KDIRIQSFETEISQKKHEPIQTKSEENSTKQENQQAVMSDRLEFFTRLTCCQALLFKSWVEASNKLIKKIQIEKGNRKSPDIPSLYINIHEEVFTNLFKSPEYASNLGKMINASMSIMKNCNILGPHSDEVSLFKQK
ncbi:MAG: poly(R)-hydroxyalkanoic acid synthase subunit PhaE, partial [Nitrosotalea sp.]